MTALAQLGAFAAEPDPSEVLADGHPLRLPDCRDSDQEAVETCSNGDC